MPDDGSILSTCLPSSAPVISAAPSRSKPQASIASLRNFGIWEAARFSRTASHPNPADPNCGVLLEDCALRFDHPQELIPGVHKRFRSIDLKLQAQGIDINTGFGELLQYLFAVAAVRGHHLSDFAVIGKRLQCGLRHRVDRVRRSQ